MAIGIQVKRQWVPISWQGIRPEYYKVWQDFPATALPLGVELSGEQLNSLGHVLVSMDLIDSAIDRQPILADRLGLCQEILDWMKCEDELGASAHSLDFERLLGLRAIIHRQRIVEPFLGAASRVFAASEGKRNASTVRQLIHCLIDEGQAAAEMTIHILGPNTNQPFNQFLQRIMRIGTIVDTLLDANEDSQNGIMKLRPTRMFRWRLKVAVGRQLPHLILGYPDRRFLCRYCLSYV